jgi:hypothetical protein
MLVLAVSLAVVLVAGCSKKENAAGGGGGGGAVTSPPVVVSPTTYSSGGTSVNIGGGSLPTGFPSTFALPDGATPVNSVSGAGGFFVWFSSPQSIDDLRSFFDENLATNGWKIDSKTDVSSSGGQYTAYTIEGNGFSGVVYLGSGAPGASQFGGQYQFYVQLSPA